MNGILKNKHCHQSPVSHTITSLYMFCLVASIKRNRSNNQTTLTNYFGKVSAPSTAVVFFKVLINLFEKRSYINETLYELPGCEKLVEDLLIF